MNLVVRYASAELGPGAWREKVLPVGKRLTQGTSNWHEFVSMAMFHKLAGERIVSVAEEGY